MDPSASTLVQRPRLALSAQGITMQFGGVLAVADLNLKAEPGRVTSLIGPNGAGKTTALKMLSGLYVPTAGAFALGGRALAGHSAVNIARAGVARTYQTSLLFNSLSVMDNVVLAMHRGRLGPLLGAALRTAPACRAKTRRGWQACCAALPMPAWRCCWSNMT